jgi:epoxide hydrolase-like predicted phosphatase
VIKAVLFDYGGVLSESGKVGNIQAVLGEIYGLDPKSIEMADLHYQFLRGQIDEAQFFGELNKRYGKSFTANQELFAAKNQGFFTPSRPVYDLAAKLRATGIKTGILSNIYPASAQALREAGAYNEFDPVVLSCEEQCAKPDRVFFEAALRKLGAAGNEVLFIDDQERFREVAEGLGMHFIVATSPEQIVADTKALILKENGITL